jgi:hypothetical protein
MIMKYSYSVLAFVTGTALLVAAGCSKQEPAAPPAADNTAKSQQSAVSEQPPAAAPAAPEPAAAAKPVVAAPVSTPPVAVPAPAAAQPVATTPAAPPTNAIATSLASLQQTGTDQLRALAAGATNRALSAVGVTNQAAVTTTNQVEALLEQAKSLTANQKYQEALGTLTELYKTKLTPEQKQQADALKVQAQTALTQKATSALGGFLGGKK